MSSLAARRLTGIAGNDDDDDDDDGGSRLNLMSLPTHLDVDQISDGGGSQRSRGSVALTNRDIIKWKPSRDRTSSAEDQHRRYTDTFPDELQDTPVGLRKLFQRPSHDRKTSDDSRTGVNDAQPKSPTEQHKFDRLNSTDSARFRRPTFGSVGHVTLIARQQLLVSLLQGLTVTFDEQLQLSNYLLEADTDTRQHFIGFFLDDALPGCLVGKANKVKLSNPPELLFERLCTAWSNYYTELMPCTLTMLQPLLVDPNIHYDLRSAMLNAFRDYVVLPVLSDCPPVEHKSLTLLLCLLVSYTEDPSPEFGQLLKITEQFCPKLARATIFYEHRKERMELLLNLCRPRTEVLAEAKTQAIDMAIEHEKSQLKRNIKLLLLGAGECGKSTVLKQMKILHNNGFSDDEIREQRSAIYSNVVNSMNTLLHAMNTNGIMLDSKDNEKWARIVLDTVEADDASEPLTSAMVDAIEHLWQDEGIREAWHRRIEFHLVDSAQYFFESVRRIGQADYRPTEMDILFARVRTTGVNEIVFVIKSLTFSVYDVGGQRSERRKWIHCFDNVNGIVFISAVNEYDQTLVEDNKTNRLSESINLFDSICNSRWFEQTSIILFLNKTDLFKEKIKRVPLRLFVDEGESPSQATDFESGLTLLEAKFLSVNQTSEKTIYCHRTCATDTNQLQLVLDNVIDMLIEKNVTGCGLS